MSMYDIILVRKFSGCYLAGNLQIESFVKPAVFQAKFPNLGMLGTPTRLRTYLGYDECVTRRKQKSPNRKHHLDIDFDTWPDSFDWQPSESQAGNCTVTSATAEQTAPVGPVPGSPVLPSPGCTSSPILATPPRALSLSPHLSPPTSPIYTPSPPSLPLRQPTPTTPYDFFAQSTLEPPSPSYYEDRLRENSEFLDEITRDLLF